MRAGHPSGTVEIAKLAAWVAFPRLLTPSAAVRRIEQTRTSAAMTTQRACIAALGATCRGADCRLLTAVPSKDYAAGLITKPRLRPTQQGWSHHAKRALHAKLIAHQAGALQYDAGCHPHTAGARHGRHALSALTVAAAPGVVLPAKGCQLLHRSVLR